MAKEFWAKVVLCVVYSCFFTKRLKNMTPLEALSGKKPNVFHLHVFGSLAYAHVSKQVTSKLYDRSQ